MKIKILKQAGNEIEIEIIGEGHSFCNILQNALNKNENTDFVGYRISHPLISHPILYLRTKGMTPKNVLIDTSERLASEIKELNKTFKEMFKN